MHARALATAYEVTRLTPILIVENIEPCIRFWTGDMGFKADKQIPDESGKLMFAIVEKDGIEIMYQTRASVILDRPDARSELVGHATALFFEVRNLDALEKAVAGAPIVKARHRTFYGSTEIYIREPGGNTIGFAEFA